MFARSEFLDYIVIISFLKADPGQFLATESLLKMVKETFYFTLKTLFVLKISKFLS